MKRNAEIEFYRFLMIMGVAILHFSEDYSTKVFYGGYLGVDFFFMLSGYFLMVHFLKHEQMGVNPVRSSLTYVMNRIKKLYPPYFVTILLMTAVRWIHAGGGMGNLWLLIYQNRWQYLMLHSVGAPTACIIRSVWFLSPLIVLSYFIYFCLCINKEKAVGLAPIISLIGFVFIAQKYGFLGIHFEYIGIFGGGFVRGLPEMLLGVFLAYLVEEYYKDKKVIRNDICGILLRMVCYVVILWTMWRSQWNFEDFNVLPTFALLIMLSFVNPIKCRMEKVMIYLGGISYWIYLLHIVVGFVLANYFPGRSYPVMLLIYILCVIGMASFLRVVQKYFGKVNSL